VSQQSLLVVVHEDGSSRISTIRSRYVATTSENITDLEGLVCAVVICSVCRIVRVLYS
jgi:hypothetical protein